MESYFSNAIAGFNKLSQNYKDDIEKKELYDGFGNLANGLKELTTFIRKIEEIEKAVKLINQNVDYLMSKPQ